ncbi:MAG: hypothetical protein GKR91_02360 [Pseudomonadales bacterium]|nr:hypothetical protein [Pseudomonadales bacterium]
MSEYKFLINPAGSNFSYQDLKYVFEQNFAFLELASGYTFAPLEETDEPAGSILPDAKVIGFLPSSEFPNLTFLALAKRGIMFNIGATGTYDLSEIRGLGLHELGHNLRMRHTDNPYSVMSMFRFRTKADKSLLWRADLLRLHDVEPKTPNPVGWVSVDKELNVMIPAVQYGGSQWCVRLKHLSGATFIADKYYEADDGVSMEEKAVLTSDDQLHLSDVSYLGFSYPSVRFQITPDFKFNLITE